MIQPLLLMHMEFMRLEEGGDAVFNGTGKSGGSGIVVIRYQIGTTDTSDAKATGGAISFAGGKTIHTFTASGDFNLNNNGGNPLSVEFLAIAGGGGGGNGTAADLEGGGGGAGALYSTDTAVPSPQRASNATVSPGPNTITVGAARCGKCGSKWHWKRW